MERVLKKGKSSEFNPRNNEQVKSSQTIKVWLHGGFNLYPKIAQGIVEVFLGSKGPNDKESVEKSSLSHHVWSLEDFEKKSHFLAKIPVLGNVNHMTFPSDLRAW